MSGDDSKKIFEFPQPEIAPEERARRLLVEVERLARLPPAEWMLYLPDVAKKYGVSPDVLKKMIEKTISANEKKAREDKAEDRLREQRAEKKEEKESKARREAEECANKEAKRRQQEKEKALAAVIKLPSVEHEGQLRILAKQFGEDVEILREEFAELRGEEEERIKSSEVKPWDEPVDTRKLLDEVTTQIRKVHHRPRSGHRAYHPVVDLLCVVPQHRGILTNPGIRERRFRRGQDCCEQNGRLADAPCAHHRRANRSGILSFR